MGEYEFKVVKTANDIEDINISYGLCKILEDNDIDFNLKDNKSMYSIYTEEFDIEDITYIPIDINRVWNVNKTLDMKPIQTQGNVEKANIYLEENIIGILKYYLTNEYVSKSPKNVDSIGIGNVFYGYGIRDSKKPNSVKQSSYTRWLSFLGWIYSTTYRSNNNIEVTLLLKPNNIEEISSIISNGRFDSEGNIKRSTYYPNSSDNKVMAQLYLEMLTNNNTLDDEYSGIYMIIHTPQGGNRPSIPNNFRYIQNYNISNKFLNIFLSMLKQCKKEDIEMECAISNYILNINKADYFINLLELMHKKDNYNFKIDIKIKEEMLNMQEDNVKIIYANNTVLKLAKGLNYLLYKENKGYDSQVTFYNTYNKEQLFEGIFLLNTQYKRYLGSSLMNNEEMLELNELITNKKQAKICAKAILSLESCFIVKK